MIDTLFGETVPKEARAAWLGIEIARYSVLGSGL
jgi:hypothetical protein